jgi:hypothetical protein
MPGVPGCHLPFATVRLRNRGFPLVHVDRGFFNWGLFLIAVGAVPIAVRAELVPSGVRWWELWPLLLVGWGVGLILGRTAFALLGGALVAIAIGLIVGGILSSTDGIRGFASGIGGGCGSGSGSAFEARTGSFAADPATVELDPGCGTLDVSVGGTGWQISGTSADGTAPEIDASAGGLRVRSAGRGFDLFDSRAGAAWQVRLPENQAIDLSIGASAGTARLALANSTLRRASISVNAGTTRADFTGAALERLDVTANAGDARLTLPASTLSGSLTANAGSIAICVPDGTGLRVSMGDAFLAGNNFEEHGLARDGDQWTSPGYAGATAKIDLSATANAGSITLNPDGGCR